MSNELDQIADKLHGLGWKVERPKFDDPFEIKYREMMFVWGNSPGATVHPADDPRSEEYEWTDFDDRALAYLKANFEIKA